MRHVHGTRYPAINIKFHDADGTKKQEAQLRRMDEDDRWAIIDAVLSDMSSCFFKFAREIAGEYCWKEVWQDGKSGGWLYVADTRLKGFYASDLTMPDWLYYDLDEIEDRVARDQEATDMADRVYLLDEVQCWNEFERRILKLLSKARTEYRRRLSDEIRYFREMQEV